MVVVLGVATGGGPVRGGGGHGTDRGGAKLGVPGGERHADEEDLGVGEVERAVRVQEETGCHRAGEEEVPTRRQRLTVDDADRVVAEGGVRDGVGDDPTADQARGAGHGLRILGLAGLAVDVGVIGGDGDEALLPRQVDDRTGVDVVLAVLDLPLERRRIDDHGVPRGQTDEDVREVIAALGPERPVRRDRIRVLAADPTHQLEARPIRGRVEWHDQRHGGLLRGDRAPELLRLDGTGGPCQRRHGGPETDVDTFPHVDLLSVSHSFFGASRRFGVVRDLIALRSCSGDPS